MTLHATLKSLAEGVRPDAGDREMLQATINLATFVITNRDTILAALEAYEWRPIEEAGPEHTDGSFVIMHVPHAEPEVSLGFYDGGPEWLIVEGDIMPSKCYPTHFRPLPSPPVGEG